VSCRGPSSAQVEPDGDENRAMRFRPKLKWSMSTITLPSELPKLSLVYSSAGMLVLGFPNALTLGILAGILEFIPMAGWMIAAATIISGGALTHSHWIWMLVLLCLWRILMDYLIAPRVMGHQLEIHPLLALFTLMVGGAIGGIVGI
jgi:predicted PurR-regulated permease PerM